MRFLWIKELDKVEYFCGMSGHEFVVSFIRCFNEGLRKKGVKSTWKREWNLRKWRQKT